MPVPSMKPIKVPTVDMSEAVPVFSAKIISPKNAPRSIPISSPTGGINIPSIIPIIEPQTAYFVPPNFLVISGGR